ncbi:partial Tol-Pal system protein TolB, partial [Anaerolineae bacterium]
KTNKYGPTWSPDGTQIAFYDDAYGRADIWVINADGSNLRQLTFFNSWDGHPAWSPDGSKIAYISTGTGVYELWTMNADGANQTRVYYAQYGLLYPDWSPDGSKLIFNINWGGDGFLDIGTGAPDGTQFAIIASTSTNTDLLAPVWDPSGRFFAFTNINWIYYQGSWYWTDAYVIARDLSGSTTWPLANSGEDWWASWHSLDTIPPSSSASSPNWSNSANFVVAWSGSDAGQSSIATYDVQYRDGPNGAWIDWLLNTADTSGVFSGRYNHTYYFRSRARDFASNLEAYPGGNGDTSTTVYQYSLSGQVLGNRNQPVAAASVETAPTTINDSLSRHDGLFDLYFASGGTYTLTTTRNAFGVLPPLFNVSVPLSTSLPTLYLPPLNDQLSDGHFESGTLAAWNPIGLLTPTITSTAHTGEYAALLGGIVPLDTVSGGPYLSAIEQTITMSMTLTDGTLSLLYEVTAADPLSDTLTAYLVGPTDTLTFTLPVTATAWTHHWFDVSAWTSPTATLRIELSTPDKEREVGVLVDEVTWGSSVIGSRPIYLPVMRR